MSNKLALKLMTYNIGGGRKNLGSQFSTILRIIEEENPDILAVQEAVKWKSLNGDQFDQAKKIAESGINNKFFYFGSTLKMQENFHVKKELFIHAVFNDCENLEQGNALFSRWPFTRLGDSNKSGSPQNIPLYKVLYGGNRESDPRHVILSRINMGHAKAFLMTTHLTTLYGERGSRQIPQKSEDAQMMRWEQCERILDLIREYVLEKNELTLLMGDFNAAPNEPAIMSSLEKKGGFVRLIPNNNIGTHLKLKSPVDHILIFPGKYHIKYNCRIYDDNFSASDHNPVVADIVIFNSDTVEHKKLGAGVFKEKVE